MKYKVILVNNSSAAAKAEKLLHEGWTIQNAYGTANTLCFVMIKR